MPLAKRDGWHTEEVADLADAFLCLKSREEVFHFLRDLLTEAEIAEFARRFKAARMLDRDVPYTDIEKETGLSSTTVARVSRWLRSGEKGYRLAIDRLSRKMKKRPSR